MDRAASLRSQAFASSTKRTYNVHLRSYITFCSKLGILPVPISPTDVACYIAFLSTKMCFASIKQYLNIIKLLHLEAGLTDPLENNWMLSSLLSGARRAIQHKTRAKLPITLDILYQLFFDIDLQHPLELCFWAACLTAFFSFLRKSNLVPISAEAFDPVRHLNRSDFQFGEQEVLISVRATKTIQFSQKSLSIPIPRIPDSPLCPAVTLWLLFRTNPAPDTAPAFSFRQGTRLQTLTYPLFQSILKSKLQSRGIDSTLYGSHSFRRGGASAAFFLGNLSADQIRIQGDWASDAYQKYLAPDAHAKHKIAMSLRRMIEHFHST